MIFDQGPYLCIGADPHKNLLSEWGLADSPKGLEDFVQIFLGALPAQLQVVKPQVSLFESYGSQGFAVLENFLSELKAKGKYVIADAKRADIGSSMKGYSDAWLTESAPFKASALTVNPYLGVKSLAETIAVAVENEKRVFVLVATSNPEAEEIQSKGLSKAILDELSAFDPSGLGVVVGATVDKDLHGLGDQLAELEIPILAPGFGVQGAKLSEASAIFEGASNKLIANVSRAVLNGERENLSERIKQAMAELA